MTAVERDPALDTRVGRLYEQIQKHHAQDPRALTRLRNLLTTTYLEVPHGYFHGKRCIDVGCGATGRALWSMVQMGADRVYGLDVDPGYVERLLAANQDIADRIHLDVGSVLALPYEDESFDVVHCDGVLHHCPGEEPRLGFAELARITRPGGMLYLTVSGRGGLLNWLTRPAHLVASRFDPITLERLLMTLTSDPDKVANTLSSLCPPVYEYRFTERQVRGWFEARGFTDIRRLTRYPRYDNYRQYLAPLYYNYQWALSRALYGEGYIQVRGIRPDVRS